MATLGRRRKSAAELAAAGSWLAGQRGVEERGGGGDGEPWAGVSGQLHAAIEDSGLSIRKLSRQTHVNLSRLYRFSQGDENALTVSDFDRLCEHFGLFLAFAKSDPRAARHTADPTMVVAPEPGPGEPADG